MFLLGSLLAILIGGGCLVGSVRAFLAQRRKRERASAESAGVVLSLEKRVFNPGSGGVFCPVVEFATATGEVYRFESSHGTMPASHSVGQTVRVRYDPQAPAEAEIAAGTADWLVPGCLLAFGAVGLFFGLVFAALHFLLAASGS